MRRVIWLSVESYLRYTVGTRRPSVFGANIYNQHLDLSSDGDETQPIVAHCPKSEVQGAVNGPVSQFSHLQRIKRHIQHTEFYWARCSATISSSDCTKRRQEIRRWDSEREHFYNDIAHALQNTKKENLLPLTNCTIARQVLRIKSWNYESATEFPLCSYTTFIPCASRGPSACVY